MQFFYIIYVSGLCKHYDMYLSFLYVCRRGEIYIYLILSYHQINCLLYARGAKGQTSLRNILSPLVKEVLTDKTLVINTSPTEASIKSLSAASDKFLNSFIKNKDKIP